MKISPRKYGIPIIAGGSLIPTAFILFGLSFNTTSESHQADHTSHTGSSYPKDIQNIYPEVKVNTLSPYNIEYVRIDDNWINTEISCDFCTRVEYVPNPSNSTQFSLKSSTTEDIGNAKTLSFFILGQHGNEVVKFKAIGKITIDTNSDKTSNAIGYAIATSDVNLSTMWKKIEIDISNTDLTRVISPLAVEMEDSHGPYPMVFYIKGFRYENTSAENPLPIENININHKSAG